MWRAVGKLEWEDYLVGLMDAGAEFAFKVGLGLMGVVVWCWICKRDGVWYRL